jgi:hypothetical protein
MTNPIDLLKRCSEMLGDGFDVPKDREGWFFECGECKSVRSGAGGSHREDCKRGALIKDIDDYLELCV